MTKTRIMDWRIVSIKKPPQYAVRFILAGGGRTSLTRLRRTDGTRIAPTSISFENEPDTLKIEARIAILQLLQDRIVHDRLIPDRSKFKTCREAMERYLDQYEENYTDRSIRGNATVFIEYFCDKPLNYLSKNTAKNFAEYLIERGYSYHTVRIRLAIPSMMVNWLADNGQWYTQNPFSKLMSRYERRFPAQQAPIATITDKQHQALWDVAQGKKYRAVRLFIEIARCTGLRVSEIKNLSIDGIDHKNLTWEVLVTKTRGRKYHRFIAIPARLPVFLMNEGISDELRYPRLEPLFREARSLAGLPEGITLKTFRKDFAHRMEQAGASGHVINVHQGRAQTGVLYKNYLTDPNRAVTLCRPFISLMFGEKTIERIK